MFTFFCFKNITCENIGHIVLVYNLVINNITIKSKKILIPTSKTSKKYSLKFILNIINSIKSQDNCLLTEYA